jgi:hypothetical protein
MDDLRAGHVAVLATRMLAQSALPDAPVVAVRTLNASWEWLRGLVVEVHGRVS